HLPTCTEEYHQSLPPQDVVVELMMRREGEGGTSARRTSLLFPFFAQWFTDSFLRTDPSNYRKNQSNHGIDLCQIYGLTEEQTTILRALKGGRLKSQEIAGQEYGADMFEKRADGSVGVKKEFGGLYSKEDFDRAFGTLTDEQRLRCFAVGLERGNA